MGSDSIDWSITERRAAYQALFLHQVDEETLTGIREAANKGAEEINWH